MIHRVRLMLVVAMAVLTVVLSASANASEGYFYQGFSAFTDSFYLIGGQYQLYVKAQLPTSPFNTNARPCTFSSVFERISPNPEATALGPGGLITTGAQYQVNQTLTLPAGLYRTQVGALTTCSWNFDIISTTGNNAGLAPPQLRKNTQHGWEVVNTISLADSVEFYAPYRYGQQTKVSGTLEIINGGRIVGSFPLRGDGVVGRCNVFFFDSHWDASDTKYLGKNVARMNVKIGPEEFMTSAEFTVTP
jgi:hypothetical protein